MRSGLTWINLRVRCVPSLKSSLLLTCPFAPIEEYDAALERMNGQMSSENNALLNDNKQLGALIKEYEQTLESVMAAFRFRAVRNYLFLVMYLR